jgi:hypothetical protein
MLLCNFSWLNTTFMENRQILNTSDIDGFIKVQDLEYFVVNFF